MMFDKKLQEMCETTFEYVCEEKIEEKPHHYGTPAPPAVAYAHADSAYAAPALHSTSSTSYQYSTVPQYSQVHSYGGAGHLKKKKKKRKAKSKIITSWFILKGCIIRSTKENIQKKP